MKIRKIKLSFGTTRDAESKDVDEDLIKRAVSESRWRPGIALVNERQLEVTRLKTLDEFIYSFNGHTLDNKTIDAFLPTEYMDWRDG
jgi:menaquinone-dependent protoporphyrinogen IX oxidase